MFTNNGSNKNTSNTSPMTQASNNTNCYSFINLELLYFLEDKIGTRFLLSLS